MLFFVCVPLESLSYSIVLESNIHPVRLTGPAIEKGQKYNVLETDNVKAQKGQLVEVDKVLAEGRIRMKLSSTNKAKAKIMKSTYFIVNEATLKDGKSFKRYLSNAEKTAGYCFHFCFRIQFFFDPDFLVARKFGPPPTRPEMTSRS